MSRQRAAPREPPRLNAFQLHYLNQVIPKYQTGPSFTAYDESLEAAYDWLHNFDQAMKNNADAALLAKTPGKATARKAKVVAKPPTGGRPLFEIRPENVVAPVVKPSTPAPVAQKTTKPSAPAFSLPFANKENSSTPKAAVLSPGPAHAVKSSVASNQHSKLPTPVQPAKLASPVKVAAPVPSPAPVQLQEQEDEEEAAVEHSISLEGNEVNDQLPSSPIVVVSHPAPSEFSRSRASSFGDGGQTTDDDGQRTDNERTGFGGKSRPASLFSQMSLASTAATSASEWEGNQAQAEEDDVAEKRETGKKHDKEEENVDEERLFTVKESVSPTAASPKEEVAAPAVEPLVVSIQEAESAVEDAQAITDDTPNSQASPEPTVAAAPAAPPKPSRPVRSSWLRSALGAEVGAPAGPGPGGARKSQGAALVAAAREKERERERDMAVASMLATPAAPVRSKRKSEEIEAVDDVDEDDHTTRSALSRSTKIIKLDDRPLPPASSATLPSNQASSTTPFKRAIFSPPAEDNAEDGMSRVRKAMEELSARTKGRGMSTVGLGTLGGSILGNQTLVGRLTMPVGQVAAGTPTFSAAINGPGEDVPTPSPENSESKQLQEISQPVQTEEVAPAPETSAPSVAPAAEPAPVVEATLVASTVQPAAAPAPEERSFEIIDLTQSMNSLPPTPARANAKSPSRKGNNATSSFGSLMGDLEAATTTPSPPPTPPPAAPAKTTKASASTFKTATPQKSASRTVDTSTTPMASPPKKRLSSNDGDLTLEDLEQSIVIDEEEDVRVLKNAPANRLAGKSVPKMKEKAGTAEVDDEDLIMDVPLPKSTKQQAGVRSREGSAAPSGSNLKQSVSKSSRQDNAGTRLAVSTSSKIAAEKIAGKKPQVDEVKSLQLAAEAAKKEQDARDRRAAVSKIAEANRHRAAALKAAEEKAKEEEEKRKKMEEVRERKARMAELEKRRKEREAKEKEKRELLAAAKLAEEESKKRKAAPINGGAPQPKRLQSSVGPSSVKVPAGKIATKMGMASSSSTNKVVPSFNHLPPGSKSGASSQAGPSSIRLVGSGMGPPIRTSDMGKTLGPKLGQNNRPSQAQGAQVLQAQRQALQSQLSKSQGNQSPHGDRPGESEAIELADIDSEYSDSDDEDRPRSGKDAPPWAQSPEVRNALKQQETHNPDDIFGRMKPIIMDEVFRARAGKFRARTSSANWTNDGVTPQEELAYGKRMGWENK